MSEMEHLPSKDFANWHRGHCPEFQFLFFIRKGRKWAGSDKLTRKNHVWRTGARTGREPPGFLLHSEKDMHFLCLHSVLQFTKQTPSHWNLTLRLAQLFLFSRWRHDSPEITDTLDQKSCMGLMFSCSFCYIYLSSFWGQVGPEWVECEELCKQ